MIPPHCKPWYVTFGRFYSVRETDIIDGAVLLVSHAELCLVAHPGCMEYSHEGNYLVRVGHD